MARVLPPLLLDFFPVQEIMNKVIGEFLSSQQPHPELMAQVLFKVCVCSVELEWLCHVTRQNKEIQRNQQLHTKVLFRSLIHRLETGPYVAEGNGGSCPRQEN